MMTFSASTVLLAAAAYLLAFYGVAWLTDKGRVPARLISHPALYVLSLGVIVMFSMSFPQRQGNGIVRSSVSAWSWRARSGSYAFRLVTLTSLKTYPQQSKGPPRSSSNRAGEPQRSREEARSHRSA